MSGKESVVGATVAVYNAHRIAEHGVVAWPPASDEWLRYIVSQTVGKQHAQEGTPDDKQNLRHCLIVLHYKQKQ